MCCAVSRRARSPNRPRQKLSREFRRQCRRASASADAAVARNLKARSGVCIMLLSWSIMSRCSQLSAFAPAFQSLHHFHFIPSLPFFPSLYPSMAMALMVVGAASLRCRCPSVGLCTESLWDCRGGVYPLRNTLVLPVHYCRSGVGSAVCDHLVRTGVSGGVAWRVVCDKKRKSQLLRVKTCECIGCRLGCSDAFSLPCISCAMARIILE